MFSRQIHFHLGLVALFLINVFPDIVHSSSNPSEVLQTGEENLDSEKYILKWEITSNPDEIHFEVIAQTSGYVGLGISPTGGMAGADIFIAGVHENGTAYSSDRHATDQSIPIVDQHSDWTLDAAYQTDTHTILRFHRLLNTCDEEEDYIITAETMRIIWAVGNSDDINQHFKRGTKSINFFLQDGVQFEPRKFDKFDIITKSKMPTQDTSYLCTFHEGPRVTEERQYVAFEPVLNSTLALEYTHHFTLFKCVAPKGLNPEELFGPFVGKQGKHCYANYAVNEFPIAHCMLNVVYVWSKGGKRMVFPPEIGYPIPGRRDTKEYYAMEVHYDNPNELDEPVFQTGVRMYYTKKEELREIDAGILLIIHDIAPQLTIPPQSQNFVVSAHCSGKCTDANLPDEGVTIFNNKFHSHIAGRKMKLRHFRRDKELPWIDVDDHYDFNYQQSKPLSNPVKLLKGDQLTLECTYDSSDDPEHKAVIGGLSTHEEMCQAILFVYPKSPISLCHSSQSLNSHFKLLGVSNYIMKKAKLAGGFPAYDIVLPERLAGDYLESVSYKVEWTDDFRKHYQQEKRFGLQEASCITERSMDCCRGEVKYPDNVAEYAPINECAASGGTEFLRPNSKYIARAVVALYLVLRHFIH